MPPLSKGISGNPNKDSMTKAQWKRFHDMEDKDIDTSDIPEFSGADLEGAKVIKPRMIKTIE